MLEERRESERKSWVLFKISWLSKIIFVFLRVSVFLFLLSCFKKGSIFSFHLFVISLLEISKCVIFKTRIRFFIFSSGKLNIITTTVFYQDFRNNRWSQWGKNHQKSPILESPIFRSISNSEHGRLTFLIL